jgi:cbb3-type cytochrome oxidase maturation protein
MEVLIYLVTMALALGLLGLGGFLWSLKTGQYDDLDGAAWRAILDEDDVPPCAKVTGGETADGGDTPAAPP